MDGRARIARRRERIAGSPDYPRHGGHGRRVRAAVAELRVCPVHLRARQHVEAAMMHVGDDADDREPDAIAAHRHAAADRARAGPVFLRHRLVDDDHGKRRRGVGIRERTPFTQRSADGLEVAGGDDLPVGGNRPLIVRRASFDADAPVAPRARQRKSRHAAGGLHSGRFPQTPAQVGVRAHHRSGRGVGLRRQRRSKRECVRRIEAGVDVEQALEAPRQQQRRGDEHHRRRHFADDERAAQPAGGDARVAPAFLQHRLQVGPR